MSTMQSQDLSSQAVQPSLPRTPQPPISPPKRSSSLAFNNQRRTLTTPINREDSTLTQTALSPNSFQPNVGRKRTTASPFAFDATSPNHVFVSPRVFQAAKATLHRDMFAASSPDSSIGSRMNIDQDSPMIGVSQRTSALHDADGTTDEKTWRYSMAPPSVAAVSIDVREPLPSPTLPDLTIQRLSYGSDGIEPKMPSPLLCRASDGTLESHLDDLESSHSTDNVQCTQETALDKQLTQLKVSMDDSDEGPHQESPIVTHLKRKSYGSPGMSGQHEYSLSSTPERDFYLSPSAEAAANSAKAKRRLLREMPSKGHREGEFGGPLCDSAAETSCPSLAMHRSFAGSPCPDPAVHSYTPPMVRTPISAMTSSMGMLDSSGYRGQPLPAGAPRATSTGSPMPFIRARSRPGTSQEDTFVWRSATDSHQRDTRMDILNEHFRPGWYYSGVPVRPSPRQAYSFSTAASKVMGADPAPDSRMRDSYRTDTLTALPEPSGRYRKNGIGAEVTPRGVNRYYSRPTSSLRPPSARSRPSSRQTYTSGSDVRFRSSPPRVSEPYMPVNRKRAMDDSYMVAGDSEPRYVEPVWIHEGSDSTIEVDEHTKAAVRMSIFGTNTPEALRKARRDIKELSPNVQVFRRGTQEHAHLRKKRRPSYWDSDLKEVRESPAGRGGVNSPVSAQASMQAEFEIASLGDTDMHLDEEELAR